MMNLLRSFVHLHPRIAAALAFGLTATGLIYLAWIPGPNGRMEGYRLFLAVGITHALAGTITGLRVVHPAREPKLLHAGLWGAGTSLLALLIFSQALAFDIFRTDAGHSNPLPLMVLTFVFSFLGSGWALILLSTCIGCGLHQLAVHYSAAS